MIIKNKSRIPISTSQKRRILPIIPVKSAILFPGESLTLQLTSKQNLKLIDENTGRSKMVGVVFSPRGKIGNKRIDLSQIGTAARIISRKEGPGKSKIVILEGINRISLQSIHKRAPYLMAKVDFINEKDDLSVSTGAFTDDIIKLISQITKTNPAYAESLLHIVRLNLEDPGRLADRISNVFHFPVEIKQDLLEALKIETRLKELRRQLKVELSKSTVYYNSKSGKSSANNYYTHSQGCEGSLNNEIADELQVKIRRWKKIPDEVKERCSIEIDRLRRLPATSAEFGSTKQYLDWLLALPWNVYGSEKYDLKRVEKDIAREYYGPHNIKRTILERIAIRKLSGKSDEASVLCLAGVPGTGKASLAKAIAKALGKEFLRISVGGIDDVDDIKGSTRTFIGALPGIFVRTLRNATTSDPLIFIEDIDSFGEDSTAVLNSALLEAIDPRLNSKFLDDYIGLPINLNRIFFVCAIKSSEDLPDIFTPRLEIVELPGYIEKEKIHIGNKYIIPELITKHGLLKKDVKFTATGLRKIIRNYTLEAGLLGFKRKLEIICRHIAREKASKVKKIWTINEKTAENILGVRQYTPEKPGSAPEIGVATGLAWTGLGGDLMMIEGLKMKGSGEVISTGSLGEVMKESIQAAHSYVRSKADILGIDHNDFDNFDIHIHFPSGAIPKDGPSAGVAVSLVIASVMSERPIPNDIAMTGEVTLRGKILQVGGLVEKISAAYRVGIPKIFIPKSNKKDLKDLPIDILKKTKFIFIDSVDDVFAYGLLDFVPSSYTLEKLFEEELKKAKGRKKEPSTGSIAAKGSRKKKRSKSK